MGRTQQTGTRDRSNVWWMKTKKWRGRVYVWAKEPMEQVKPNIEGKRGINLDKGVNWVTVSATKRPARHGRRRIHSLTNFQISFAQMTRFQPVKKLVRGASSCNVMRT